MKKLILPILLFIAFYNQSAGQLVNPSFEAWTAFNTSNGPGEYPDGWTTSDSVTMAVASTHSAIKGIDPFDGSSSLHLKSLQYFTLKGSGLASNGTIAFNGSSFTFTGGTADTARPKLFTGHYKYMPVDTIDAAVIKVYLLKYDSVNAFRDTVAAGYTEFKNLQTSYAPFNVTLDYRQWLIHPDTFLIIFQSSRGILNDPTIAPNNEFVVDSVGFSGWVGIDEAIDIVSSVKLFPTPASNELNAEVILKKSIHTNYMIFDQTGKIVMSGKMNGILNRFDISSLAEGMYIFRLDDDHERSLYSNSFTISR
jgi:hypothetical protein